MSPVHDYHWLVIPDDKEVKEMAVIGGEQKRWCTGHAGQSFKSSLNECGVKKWMGSVEKIGGSYGCLL